MEQGRRQEGVWVEADSAPSARGPRGAFLKRHWNAVWRLFFIQSSRNERTMDGLGLFAILSPFLPKWARSREEGAALARAYLGYFNAGLYLSSAVAGVVVNMEERRARGEPVTPERIDRTAAALSSVLAARANYFFDALLIPLGLTIASIFAIHSSYVGPVIFLAVYNFYHFQSRIGGYCRGVELGEGVGEAYVPRLFREERFVAGCAAFASGVFAALLFLKARSAGGAGFIVWGAALCAGSAVLRRRLSVAWSVVLLLLATALYLVAYRYVRLR
ncbi:MAG: PTS system mannose/fructose/sorbose family transporter subunit IID [Candidatus Krumholzibacteriaceae bacterium]|jgi:PTS system mannose-specific IID component